MLISFAVTVKLICVFVFAYAKRWFSHYAALIVISLASRFPHGNKACTKTWQSNNRLRIARIKAQLSNKPYTAHVDKLYKDLFNFISLDLAMLPFMVAYLTGNKPYTDFLRVKILTLPLICQCSKNILSCSCGSLTCSPGCVHWSI